MRKHLFALLAISLLSLTACEKEKKTQGPGETEEAYVNASSSTDWNYYSLSRNEQVGTGTAADDASWAARTDWDIAIQRYNIRTNSGTSSTSNGQGGVYTCSASVSFAGLTEVPQGISFAADKSITTEGMNGSVTANRSEATVILFKTDEQGNKVMPPVYLQAPVYIFRTADGKGYFKVEFTQYKDADNKTGHVKFNLARIY